MLPKIIKAPDSFANNTNRVFVVAEGFEKRSLHWISKKNNNTFFDHAIVCKYAPSKKSRFEEMMELVKHHTKNEPIVLEYNRFAPTVFEQSFRNEINKLTNTKEIVIDISVMSKMLIMIILFCLRSFQGKVTILYSEPRNWGPSREKYNETIKLRTQGKCVGLSSVGVGNVVRTPNLSSVVMQGCPVFLIAFLSFNEQLINVLVNEINPTKLFVINHRCENASWRTDAMLSIHQDLINDFSNNKAKDNMDDYLCTFKLLEYDELFYKLAELYRNNCYEYRIVLSPTGCKLHAVSCALLKLCCPDVHIEYPTPESYLFEEYSSDSVANVYTVSFDSFRDFIKDLERDTGLNG